MKWTLRREVLRTIGILGALDPYKYQQIQLYLRAERLRKESLAHIDEEDEDSSDIHEAASKRKGPPKARSGHGGGVVRTSRSITPSLGAGADGTEGAIAVATAAMNNAHAASSTETFLADLKSAGLTLPPEQLGVAFGGGHGLLDDNAPSPPRALLDQIDDGNQVNCIALN